jgi:hypothetical protein
MYSRPIETGNRSSRIKERDGTGGVKLGKGNLEKGSGIGVNRSKILAIGFGGLLLVSPAGPCGAAPATYTVAAQSLDSGGHHASAADYSVDGSVGTVAGISSATLPAETIKAGYVAQLYRAESLQITSPAASIDVAETIQLGATICLDDGTFIAVDPQSVAWAVQSGPIASITAQGLATAAVAYCDPPAVLTGSYSGLAGTLTLSVVNVDFDAWQGQWFGTNTALAGPGVDADGTGETNLFKYIAGLDPLDPASRFAVAVTPPAGPLAPYTITFSPVAAGRSYIVEFCTDLGVENWQVLAGGQESLSGNTMSVTDPDKSWPRKFYRVQISE